MDFFLSRLFCGNSTAQLTLRTGGARFVKAPASFKARAQTARIAMSHKYQALVPAVILMQRRLWLMRRRMKRTCRRTLTTMKKKKTTRNELVLFQHVHTKVFLPERALIPVSVPVGVDGFSKNLTKFLSSISFSAERSCGYYVFCFFE